MNTFSVTSRVAATQSHKKLPFIANVSSPSVARTPLGVAWLLCALGLCAANFTANVCSHEPDKTCTLSNHDFGHLSPVSHYTPRVMSGHFVYSMNYSYSMDLDQKADGEGRQHILTVRYLPAPFCNGTKLCWLKMFFDDGGVGIKLEKTSASAIVLWDDESTVLLFSFDFSHKANYPQSFTIGLNVCILDPGSPMVNYCNDPPLALHVIPFEWRHTQSTIIRRK
jgi:hypothetical protein